jgi:hypothetical protein
MVNTITVNGGRSANMFRISQIRKLADLLAICGFVICDLSQNCIKKTTRNKSAPEFDQVQVFNQPLSVSVHMYMQFLNMHFAFSLFYSHLSFLVIVLTLHLLYIV